MSIKKIYFIALLIVTLFVIVVYIFQEIEHRKELNRIIMLEEKEQKRKSNLNHIRSKTKSCQITGLLDPRSCYFHSNYKCKWNENGERCDEI
jgi:hypothetical protein